MTNLKQILAGATLAGAAVAAGATPSTTPPGPTTPPLCNNCTPPTPPPVQPPVIVTPPPVYGGSAPVQGGSAPVQGGSAPVQGGSAPVQGGSAPVQGGAIDQSGNRVDQNGAITGNGGGANVAIEGTRIPRFTGHIGLGGAQAYAPALPALLHRCKDATSKGWNLLGLFGDADAKTETNQACLKRELDLEEKRIVCDVSVRALQHSNPLVVQSALNAMGEVCDKGFGVALTTTRNDFKTCSAQGMKVNVIGECEPVDARPVPQVSAALAHVPAQACPKVEEPKGEVRRLCASNQWKRVTNPAGTCPSVRYECVGGHKNFRLTPVSPK